MSRAERHYSVGDPDAPRQWEPKDWCPREEIMNDVLSIVVDNDGPIAQRMIVDILHVLRPGYARGTTCAHVSASLLYFTTSGWLRPTGEKDNRRSPLWEVAE